MSPLAYRVQTEKQLRSKFLRWHNWQLLPVLRSSPLVRKTVEGAGWRSFVSRKSCRASVLCPRGGAQLPPVYGETDCPVRRCHSPPLHCSSSQKSWGIHACFCFPRVIEPCVLRREEHEDGSPSVMAGLESVHVGKALTPLGLCGSAQPPTHPGRPSPGP